MTQCVICGGTEFYIVDGFYVCNECQTQNQDVREEVLELRVDPSTRVRKVRIRQDKSGTSEENLGWTTWEQYNFILIGLINEVMELGASMDIEMTILQLWAHYLGKVEVAFTSTKKKNVPKLAQKFCKKDAEIIYGKIAQRKKIRRRGSASKTSASSVASRLKSEEGSNRDTNKQKKRMIAAEYERFVQSQDSSEGDTLSLMNQSLFSVQSSSGKSSTQTVHKIRFNKVAREEFKKIKRMSMKLPRSHRLRYREKHTRTVYETGPQVITPMKLWSLIYLALRIHDENIHLADMLRYAREGHLSYYRLDHLLPPEVTLSKKEAHFLHRTNEISHNGMRQCVGTMAKFLKVWEIKKPDMVSLIERYCIELQLPKEIALYAERMMELSPPRMRFDAGTTHFPNYEGRAMAFIIVIMKILFALDGITEFEISRVVEKINRDNAVNSSCVSLSSEIVEPCIIVHGGIVADRSLNPVFVEMVEACKISASLGYQKMLAGGNSADAVEAALWWLENDEFFNCGYGSVVNNKGYVEMDACLMNGTRLECGSVVAIRDSEHPISLARYAMENYPNTIIGPNGAEILAKKAGLRSISPENIISQASYFANETKYPPFVGYFDDDDDGRDNDNIEILKTGNLGSVGCIAWDGRSLVAGTSSGGTRGKMVGRVGEASLMGCGIFANENCACCLTGHGESIIKMSLARNVLANLSNENSTPREALKKSLDVMSSSLGHQAGGIVLKKDSTFGVYCTNETCDSMAYAMMRNHWITCPTEDGKRRIEKYRDPTKERLCKCDNESLASSKRGTLESRLFSFCDWQRYIECRRSVIANVHFPTKLKRDPDSMGNSHLYLKFFTAIRAKCSDRDEPDLTSCRHSIPRELADSMKKVIGRLNESPHNVPKDVKYFAPSPTPQYSYLLQSLRDPEKDLPSELRNDFNSTKVGYMMKPQALQALAGRCNIDLKIRDTGMHFLEKIVSPLEQTGSLSIRELTELVRVRLPVPVKTRCDKLSPEVCENTEEYLHRKNPGFLFVDSSKRKEYDDAHDLKKQSPCNDLIDDFGFDEMFPNSKHLIPNVYDDDDSSDKNVRSSNENDNESRGNVNDNDQSIIDLLAKYNVSLSNFEKRSLAGMSSDAPSHRKKREKRKIFRDPVTGKFVKPGREMNLGKTIDATSKIRDKENVNLCENDESASIEESIATNESRENDESTGKIVSDSCPDFGLSDDDISILHESCFSSCNDHTRDDDSTNSCNEFECLFRPYTDYWMLRGMFNRAYQSSFRQTDKSFSSNFRWLLEECSSVIEMTEEDLYGEVCLVEAYYADIFEPSKCPLTCNRYDSEKYRSKIRCNGIRKKW